MDYRSEVLQVEIVKPSLAPEIPSGELSTVSVLPAFSVLRHLLKSPTINYNPFIYISVTMKNASLDYSYCNKEISIKIKVYLRGETFS